MGFAIMDNYLKIKGMTLKRSLYNYAGLAMDIDGTANLMLALSLRDSMAAPILGSVTAALALHQMDQHHELVVVQLDEDS